MPTLSDVQLGGETYPVGHYCMADVDIFDEYLAGLAGPQTFGGGGARVFEERPEGRRLLAYRALLSGNPALTRGESDAIYGRSTLVEFGRLAMAFIPGGDDDEAAEDVKVASPAA